MNRLLRTFATLLVATLPGLPALASPVISLLPDITTVHPPGNVYLDVVVSGLHSGGTDTLLGAFDLTLVYNPSAVQLILPGPSHLGSGLGDAADPSQTLVGGDDSVAGQFRFFEVSLLEASPSDCVFCSGPYLADLQGDSFSLATLVFYAPPDSSASGAFTTFRLIDATLGDAAGNAITDFGIRNASVDVHMPEPSGVFLVATALFAALRFGRRHALARAGTQRPA